MRTTLDHTIALQKVEAARQHRLVDGERVQGDSRPRSCPVVSLMPRRVMDVILAAMADQTLKHARVLQQVMPPEASVTMYPPRASPLRKREEPAATE